MDMMKKAVVNAKKDLENIKVYRDSFFFCPSPDGRKTTTTQEQKNKVKREGFKVKGFGGVRKIEFLQPNGKVLKNCDFEKKTFEMMECYKEFIEENKEFLE